jgi:hypothetical protein
MAFSPLPRNYDEAIKEINVWRAKYTREAQSNAAPQEKRTQELPGRGENIDLLNAPAGAAPVAELTEQRNNAVKRLILREESLEKAEAENAALLAWKRDASDLCGKGPDILISRELLQKYIGEVRALQEIEEENAALREDAERYRFLRKVNAFAVVEYCGMFGPKEIKGKKLDKAIDAAREKTRKK